MNRYELVTAIGDLKAKGHTGLVVAHQTGGYFYNIYPCSSALKDSLNAMEKNDKGTDWTLEIKGGQYE
ncbi:gp51 [Listeria phage P40]|uniref:gp51 n=1 Tax=Listeria phage P40 TaxID=560178 RepID=UPI0001819900|nr:gp51 [Listeria phage P40]ACI00411.1 gp51 [Listeria phage P40]